MTPRRYLSEWEGRLLADERRYHSRRPPSYPELAQHAAAARAAALTPRVVWRDGVHEVVLRGHEARLRRVGDVLAIYVGTREECVARALEG